MENDTGAQLPVIQVGALHKLVPVHSISHIKQSSVFMYVLCHVLIKNLQQPMFGLQKFYFVNYLCILVCINGLSYIGSLLMSCSDCIVCRVVYKVVDPIPYRFDI